MTHIVSRQSVVFILLALTQAMAAPAGATDYSWRGLFVPLNWGNSNNWLPAGVPASGDTITFPCTASRKTINLDGDQTVDTVTFNSPTAYTLNSSADELTVGNLLASWDAEHTLNFAVRLAANSD